MLAKKYKSEIVSIANPFHGIYTLEFKTLGSKYKYLPGQFLHIAIDEKFDGSGQWPDSRCFSMQSNPTEETIRVTYAVKGSFTKQMEENLKVGSVVWLKLPYGALFSQPHNKINTVFISGGTGITPYLSLFTHRSFREYINPKIYLGFRTKDFNIYQAELDKADNNNALFTSFYQDSDGIMDINKILEENGIDSNYFISGPPVMIKVFKKTLLENGVRIGNVLTDDWE